MSFHHHRSQVSASARDTTAAGQHPQTPSPLLLKRLQQQKKKLAESSKRSLPISTAERAPASHGPATRTETLVPTKHALPSVKPIPSGGRRSDINRKIEAMGAREMDQYISKIQKENFDLKLSLFHLREKINKTDIELSDAQTQLTNAHSRNDELTELNDQLCAELEARDVALGDAVKMIAAYEDRVAELERLLNQEQDDHQSKGGCETLVDGKDKDSEDGRNIQSGNRFASDENFKKAQKLLSVGISPFTSRSSPRLATPCRPRLYSHDGTLISPCPSINTNLIDLNTPHSAPRSGSSFLKSSLLGGDTLLRSHVTSSHMSFINKCSSVVSESPGGIQSACSPAHSSILDSPRLSELSDSSFASMYGDREDGLSGDSESEELEVLSSDDEPPVLIGTPISCRKHRRDRGLMIAATPSRRISPRRGIIDFKEKEKEKLSSNLVRHNLPPTPESISPRRASGFKQVGDSTPELCTPPSPISSGEEKGNENSKPKAHSTEDTIHSSLESIIVESSPKDERTIITPRQDLQADTQADVGTQKTSCQNDQSLVEITNVRKRFGYNKIGRSDGVRKPISREIATGTKYANTRIGGGGRKDSKAHSFPSIKGPPPPVKTDTTFVVLSPTNPNTPPYTPENDTTAIRSLRRFPVLTRKESWESINSSIEKLDEHKNKGVINNVYRRNSIAISTNLSVALRKKGSGELALSASDRRKSSIPALVRSTTTAEKNARGVIGKGNREGARWMKN